MVKRRSRLRWRRFRKACPCRVSTASRRAQGPRAPGRGQVRPWPARRGSGGGLSSPFALGRGRARWTHVESPDHHARPPVSRRRTRLRNIAEECQADHADPFRGRWARAAQAESRHDSHAALPTRLDEQGVVPPAGPCSGVIAGGVHAKRTVPALHITAALDAPEPSSPQQLYARSRSRKPNLLPLEVIRRLVRPPACGEHLLEQGRAFFVLRPVLCSVAEEAAVTLRVRDHVLLNIRHEINLSTPPAASTRRTSTSKRSASSGWSRCSSR